MGSCKSEKVREDVLTKVQGPSLRGKIMFAAKEQHRNLANGYESKDALVQALMTVCNVAPEVDLGTKGCFFEVRAVPVSDFGLDKYGSPLNHGYIKVIEVGTKPYVIVERGGGTSNEADSKSSLITEYKCSYLQLANLFVHAYRMGGGSLASTGSYEVKLGDWFDDVSFKYEGWKNDCWTRVEEVMARAGFPPTFVAHESNRDAVDEWLASEELGVKFLVATGLAVPSARRGSESLDVEMGGPEE